MPGFAEDPDAEVTDEVADEVVTDAPAEDAVVGQLRRPADRSRLSRRRPSP